MGYKQAGGCQCRFVRYEVTEAPRLVYTCHCTDCQRITGSAFSLGMVVGIDEFKLAQGELSPLLRTASNGQVRKRSGSSAQELWMIPPGFALLFTFGRAAHSHGSCCP